MKQGVATVADGWQPTSELERRLGDAVRSGDQEGYFRLLAESELVVPVAPDLVDDVLANRRQPTWPTQDEDDRTFVLAYTSPTAMRACLGPSYRHYVRLRFTALAETWPDNNWWLAVDVPSHAARHEVSLPIEGRLPAWFLLQLAQGDPRPPLAGHHQADPSALSGPATPPPHAPAAPLQDGAHSTPPSAAAPQGSGYAPAHEDGAVQASAPSAPHVPVSEGDVSVAGKAADVPQKASRPPMDDPRATVPDLSVYTGREAPEPTAPGPTAPGPAASEAAAAGPAAGGPAAGGPVAEGGAPPLPPGIADMPPVPEPPRSAKASPAATSVDPIPVITPGQDADEPWEELQGQHRDLPRTEPRPEFQPANDVERSLLRAATDNDHDLFLQTLADAEVLLPVGPDADFTLRPGRAEFQWRTREADGATLVQVFSSPERLAEAALTAGTGTDSIRMPFPLILRYWPEHANALAINPGSPAGGTILAEQLVGLATWADQRAARRMSEEFEAQNEVEQRLFDAAVRRDTDAFFKVLLGAQVLIPAEPETPWGITPDDPEFPWRPSRVHGRVAIQLFTSLRWMNEAVGSSRFVMPTFLEVVAAWPDADWTLVLNPGTPVDAAIPGEQVRALSGPTEPSPETAARADSPGQAEAAGADTSGGRPDGHVDAPAGADAPRPTDGPGLADMPYAEANGQTETAPSDYTGTTAPTEATDRTDTSAHGTPSGHTDTSGRADVSGRAGTNGLDDASGLADASGLGDAHTRNDVSGPAGTSMRDDARGLADASTRDDLSGPPDADKRVDVSGPAGTNGPGDVRGFTDAHAREDVSGPAGTNELDDASGLADTHARDDLSGPPDTNQRDDMSGVADASGPADAKAVGGADGRAEANGLGGSEADAGAGRPAEPGAELGAEPEVPFEPGNRIDQELYEAALGGDSDAFLRVLLAANVLVPIPQDAPLQVTPTQQEFRWEAALRGSAAVQVFTSLVRLREVLPKSRFVYADFRELIAAWPREDWAMLLNPGTRIGASLRGDQVRALAEWAIRVGLIQPVPEPEPDPSTLSSFAHSPDAAQGASTTGTLPVASGEHALPTSAPAGGAPGTTVQGDPSGAHAGTADASAPASPNPNPQVTAHSDASGGTVAAAPGEPGVGAPYASSGGLGAEGGAHAETQSAFGAGGPGGSGADARGEAEPPALGGPHAGASDAASGGFGTDARSEADASAPYSDSSGIAGASTPGALGTDAPGGAPVDAQGAFGAGAQGGTGTGADAPASAEVPASGGPRAGAPDVASGGFDADAGGAAEVRAPGGPHAGAADVASGGLGVDAPGRAGVGVSGGALADGPGVRDAAAGVGAPSMPDVVPGGFGVDGAGPGGRAPGMPGGGRAGSPGEVGSFDGVAAFGVSGERRRGSEADGEFGAEPTIMQKVVPHTHVAWYLEQGYDRVGGFVHLTADVAELLTPGQLYETLGLLYEDAPFSVADESVHVIRWPAYCPDLYRVPFGGRTEEEVASWGEAGWVLERPPFTGAGFAPGSAGSIREYKVDSVRLPFGAEMYVLGRDGSERFVAMYDPDRLAWLRPEGATPAGRTEAAR